MPRLAKTKQEAILNNVVNEINAYKARRFFESSADRNDVAAALGFVTNTKMYRRLHNPADITLGELMSIANTMNISIPVLLGLQARTAVAEEAVS